MTDSSVWTHIKPQFGCVSAYGNIYSIIFSCTTTLVCVNLHADRILLCMHVKPWTKCIHIILYGSSVSLTLMHFPVACFHSLAEVLCVSEAKAGAESLMDGVQRSRTSAVVGHITTQRTSLLALG